MERKTGAAPSTSPSLRTTGSPLTENACASNVSMPCAHFGFSCGLCCCSQESLSLLPKQEGNAQSGLRTDILFFLTQFSAASFRVALFLVFLSLFHSSYLIAQTRGGVLLISKNKYNRRCCHVQTIYESRKIITSYLQIERRGKNVPLDRRSVRAYKRANQRIFPPPGQKRKTNCRWVSAFT